MKDSNTSDVKELIPEFYYLPTFLENHNNLILGRTQDGMQVSSVVLPPWANGANDFVTKMRAALESYTFCDLGTSSRPSCIAGLTSYSEPTRTTVSVSTYSTRATTPRILITSS
jgi:hypothetical protein